MLSSQVSITFPVHYHFLQCTGVERRLIDCAHGDTDVAHAQCKKDSNYKYGAAACTTSNLYTQIYFTSISNSRILEPVTCDKAGAIKIVNDTIIQICSQGEWYSVCGDSDRWTDAQAMVACRQLGFNPIGIIKIM